jgi:hypothetical protein
MQLLLPSAKSAILVIDEPKPFSKFKGVLFVLGVLVVLAGGLDLLSRIPAASFGDDVLFQAFAPAIMLTR